jgi:hypothetical protein
LVRGENNPGFGKKRDGASSRYFGVCTKHVDNLFYWRTQVYIYGERIELGLCKTEIEAAKRHDKYIVDHNLPNPLNFPNGNDIPYWELK